MSLRKYGKYFENGNWLSRDEKVWTEYNNDSLCGKPFPNNFYYSLFKNARKNYKYLENIPFYLPIFIISGTDDPVAGKKDIIKLFYTYGKSGKKIFIKFYLNSRHELINDFEKDVVYRDVSKFILNDSIDNLHYI
jgi:alpha-beta hydrolase superfamily lysophospholipase